jgi:hypothetical protein
MSELNTTVSGAFGYNTGSCYNGFDVTCILGDVQPEHCRMNVRMQAAFILGGCLLIKAVYMIIVNYRARGRTKDRCLTSGDIIAASVLHEDLKIQNECLLNSGDGHRHKVAHQCHKHCKNPEPSTTGDSIGHCQKCKKFNNTNKAANLPHPSISIKYKRSLISNLGSTAIIQMLILTIISLVMLGASIFVLIGIIDLRQKFSSICTTDIDANDPSCSAGVGAAIKEKFGTWGGLSSSGALASLPVDSLGSEFEAFIISNGAQFLYSLIYLLLIYNLSLISMEHEWGAWESKRKRPRCTIVSGKPFDQSYFLQLPLKLLLVCMGYAAVMHWLLGQAISTVEAIWSDPENGVEHSVYFVSRKGL